MTNKAMRVNMDGHLYQMAKDSSLRRAPKNFLKGMAFAAGMSFIFFGGAVITWAIALWVKNLQTYGI